MNYVVKMLLECECYYSLPYMTTHLKVVIAECPEKVVPEARALIEIHSFS